MIRFILGEDRHIKYFVHSVESEYFVIKEACFRLIHDGEEEAGGLCEVTRGESGCYVDVKISPRYRSRRYELEISLRIADETIKNRERMEVV